MEGDVLVWDVTSGDTSVQGMGTVEIVGVLGDKISKTGPVRTSVQLTSTGVTGKPPESQQPWYAKAMAALEQVQDMLTFAPQYAGYLLVIDANGGISPLKLGAGLQIVDNVLTATGGGQAAVRITVDDEGNMVIEGAEFTVDDEGNAVLDGLAMDGDSGTVGKE
jgi:hypothetical protein